MHQRAPATPTIVFSAANLEAWTICLFMCVCELRKAGRQCVYVELTQAAEAQHTSCGHIIVRRHHPPKLGTLSVHVSTQAYSHVQSVVARAQTQIRRDRPTARHRRKQAHRRDPGCAINGAAKRKSPFWLPFLGETINIFNS